MKNERNFCMALTWGNLSPSDQARLSRQRAALLKNAQWQVGDQITIRFLGGDPALQARVRDVAREWLKFANLNFEFVSQAPSDVRVAFLAGNGSWSYMGTMCRQIPEPQPTMNFGWLTPTSEDSVLRRVVLHEFGHAIGLIHEHQNPQHGVKWNRAAVIHDLSGPPNNWDEATIDNNMFRYYPATDVVATDVDPKSIMMYPIPSSWTLDGFAAGMNDELTETDKSLVRSVYPK